MGTAALMAHGLMAAAGDEMPQPGHGFGPVPPIPHLAVL